MSYCDRPSSILRNAFVAPPLATVELRIYAIFIVEWSYSSSARNKYAVKQEVVG
jgi:hypothetical protein